MKLSETEIRVLRNLHLKGCTGKMGSLNLAARKKLLFGLVDKKLIDQRCNLTALGIELSKPNYN